MVWLVRIHISLVLAGNLFSVTSLNTGSKMRNDTEDPRIVGGFYANHSDFPFIVSIQVYYADWTHHCGGSIVTPRVVLTACRCIVSSPDLLVYRHPQSFRVVAGSGDLFSGDPHAQTVRVRKLAVHKECSEMLWTCDTGVLILRGRFHINEYVKPMKLFSTNTRTATGKIWRMEMKKKQCYSPGWGSYDGVNYGTKLKFTPVNLMSSNECDSLNCKFAGVCGIDYWQLKQVCAIHPGGVSCFGDSGGPLVCDGQVFGVVSFNWAACKMGHPMIYSDIDPILTILGKYLNRTKKRKGKNSHWKFL